MVRENGWEKKGGRKKGRDVRGAVNLRLANKYAKGT